MSAVYTIDKQRRLVLSSADGTLTREDVQGHMDRLSNDPDFNPDFSQVLDFTRVSTVELEPDDIRLFAKRKIFSLTSRRAMIVKDDLQFGLARMFATHRELEGEIGISVFRDAAEAMEWVLAGMAAS